MLKVDSYLTRTTISLSYIRKALRNQGQGFLVKYYSLYVECKETKHFSTVTKVVLVEYDSILQEPQGLQPCRRHNQILRLKERSQIPHIKPYKYPHRLNSTFGSHDINIFLEEHN